MTRMTFEPPATIQRSRALAPAHPPPAPEPVNVGTRVDALGVSRRVDAQQILHEMSLSVEPGEVVAIAGGSGAGKSTLLETLAGLQPPRPGRSGTTTSYAAVR